MTATTPIFGLLCGSYVNSAFSDPAEFEHNPRIIAAAPGMLAATNTYASNL